MELNSQIYDEQTLKTNSFKKQLNLSKLKKEALLFRCHSLSSITKTQIDDNDSLLIYSCEVF